MKIRLVSHTTPAKDYEEIADYSVQELVAFCARVSNPSNQYNKETGDKLVAYLAKHKHWSPFEMVNACLEIETTRDIGRQILRHRSFSFQEFSQRYADPTKMEFEIREARLQDSKNRQNSIEVEDVLLNANWVKRQEHVLAMALEAYEWAINNGIAKEVARSVLPEGLIKTKMHMNGTIRSWIHYIELRSSEGTQKEHRLIAKECAKVISIVFPSINKYIDGHTESQKTT